MSVLFNQKMTVYNYYQNDDTGEESWQRSVVKGIQWMHNRNEVSTSNGVQTENKVESITIDFGRSYGNKPYVPPNEFRKLPVEEKGKYWTLDKESGQDILIPDELEQEITTDYRISNLRRDYQYASIVKSITDNRHMPRLKHIKVVAK